MTPANSSIDLDAKAKTAIAEVVAAVLGVGLAVLLLAFPPAGTGLPVGVCLAGWMLIGTWIAVIDTRDHRIPNRLVGVMTVTVVAGLVAVGVLSSDSLQLGRAGVWAVMATVFMLVVHVGSSGGLGMGDVKLTFPLVFALTAFSSTATATVGTAFCVAVFTAGAVLAVRALLRHEQAPLPAAPFLLVGAGLALLAT